MMKHMLLALPVCMAKLSLPEGQVLDTRKKLEWAGTGHQLVLLQVGSLHRAARGASMSFMSCSHPGFDYQSCRLEHSISQLTKKRGALRGEFSILGSYCLETE